MKDPTPWLFAHRGSALLAPENTAASFDLALQFSAHVLEIDVRLSREGSVIVIHDATVDRTTDSVGKVANFKLNELKALDASSQFLDLQKNSWRKSSQRLLTLDEVFERYPNMGINIDIKDDIPEAAIAVAEVIRRHQPVHWVNVGSFWPRTLERFRRIAPEVTTSAGKREVAGLYFGRYFPRRRENQSQKSNGFQHASKLGVTSNKIVSTLPYEYLQIPCRYSGIPLGTKRFIEHVNRKHSKVIYWTINDKAQMIKLLKNGADGIVTDRLDIAAEVFADFNSPR